MINTDPEIKVFPETQLVGKSTRMSLMDNKTFELWKEFRSIIKRDDIPRFYSVEIYDGLNYFKDFNMANTFQKWAVTEVDLLENVSSELEPLTIPEGRYAVFLYVGRSSQLSQAYQYILGEWLPKSTYQLDDRPHFGLMTDRYLNDHPDSQEEIWIPIK